MKKAVVAILGIALTLGVVPVAQVQADDNPIHVTRQPVAKSTYAKGGTMRLAVQAQSTDGNALSYQWKYSTSNALTNPQEVAPDAGTKAVLTTTAPATAGTYYYWAEITAGTNTATSNVAQVTVVNRPVKDVAGQYDSYQYLYTSLQNGDFTALNTGDTYSINITPTASGFPSFGWQVTHYATTSGYRPRAIELRGNGRPESNNAGNSDVESPYTGYGLQAQDEITAAQHGAYVEMSAAASSSMFQEIATVPGKVYEWSMDHITRKPYTEGSSAAQNRPDVMAVVIGAAINTEADYGSTTDYYNKVDASTSILSLNDTWQSKPLDAEINGGPYVYGVNQYTYFQAIVNQVLAEQNLQPGEWDSTNVDDYFSATFNTKDRSYSTTYNGYPYYVFISSATRDLKYGTAQAETGSRWRHRSGSYSVPTGQGTTVFAFVNVYSSGSGTGNIIDNIKFQSGSAPDGQQEVSYEGESAVKGVTTKADYAYALAEVRGSTVYPLQERDVWFVPDGQTDEEAVSVNAAVGDGISWYTPGVGKLAFKNLVPGKTYRLIGIPVAAISTGLNTNVAPADVFDDGYYTDTTVKAGKDDTSDGTGANLSAFLYKAGVDGAGDPVYQGRIALAVTDSRSEFALLTKDAQDRWVPVDADGNTLTVDAAPAAANWQPGTGAALTFSGLEPGREYRLIARPVGYVELNWQVVGANEESGVIKITIPTPGQDVTPEMITRDYHVTGAIEDADDFWHFTGLDPAVEYLVSDAKSGETLFSVTGTNETTVTRGAAEKSRTMQVQAKIGGTYTQGVRVYPLPRFVASTSLTIDYEAETVGVGNGNVPANLQFRISYNNADLITGDTDADGYRQATGGNRIPLGVKPGYLDAPLLDTIVTGGDEALLFYRFSKEASYDGEYVAPVSSLHIPPRPAPSSSLFGLIDWIAETVDGKPFADYGYTGFDNIEVDLSDPAVAGVSFRSNYAREVIAARAAAPSGLGASFDTETGVFTVTGLSGGTYYDYSTDQVTWTTFAAPNDGKQALGTASVYYLRYSDEKVHSKPHSWAARVSDFPVGVEPVDLGTITYGAAVPAAAKVKVVNKAGSDTGSLNPAVTLELKDVLKDGQPYAGTVFTLPVASGNLPVLQPGAADDSVFTVAVAAGLPAGGYQATLVMHYDDGNASNGADDTSENYVTFGVNKADWVFGDYSDTFDYVDGNSIVLRAVGLPDGAQVEYSLDQLTWQDATTFTDLAYATQYEVFGRAKGDANHNQSAVQVLVPKVFTQYDPNSGPIVRINFAAETVEFLPGFAPALYRVTWRTSEGHVSGELSANQSVTDLADRSGLPSWLGIGISVQRRGVYATDGVPSTMMNANVDVPARPAAPDAGDFTTVNAASPSNATGKILQGAGTAFEYRLQGTSGTWTSANSGAAINVAFGTYEVRYPATSSAFASASLGSVKVGADREEYPVYFDAPSWQGYTYPGFDPSALRYGIYTQERASVAQGEMVMAGTVLTFVAEFSADADALCTAAWSVPGAGWPAYCDDGATLRWDVTVTGPTRVDLTVTGYEPRQVSFDANGGDGAVAAVGNVDGDEDYQVTLSDGTGLSREHYTLGGWNASPDGTGAHYDLGGTYTMGGVSATLYAEWHQIVIDESALSGLLESLKALQALGVFRAYTDESVAVLVSAMAAGQTVLDTPYPAQSDVDAAVAALEQAVAALQLLPVAPEVDDSATQLAALQALVTTVGKLNPSAYTSGSWKVLATKLAAAKQVIASSAHTSAQLAKANQELLAAWVALKKHYAAEVRTQVAKVNVAKGKSFQLAGLAYLTSGETQGLVYKSSNPKVARVSESGKIVGVKPGKATITATAVLPGANGKNVSTKVSVRVLAKPHQVKKAALSLKKTLSVGTVVKLTPKLSKWATPSRLTYKSSNPKVIAIDKTGKLRALKPGTAKITITAGPKKKTYKLTVK